MKIPVIDMLSEYFPQLYLAYKRELLRQHQQGPVVVDQRPDDNSSKDFINYISIHEQEAEWRRMIWGILQTEGNTKLVPTRRM